MLDEVEVPVPEPGEPAGDRGDLLLELGDVIVASFHHVPHDRAEERGRFAVVVKEQADDQGALIVLNPPTYTAGYEKFFDTAGRLTWDEPTYGIFDPAVDIGPLMDSVDGKAALVLCLQETEPGNAARPPVYARHAGTSRYTYYLSNRPEEVTGYVGGVRVVPRTMAELEHSTRPVLPAEHRFGPDSTVSVVKLSAGEAAFWRELWTHRAKSAGTGYHFGVVVDGFLCAIGGLALPTSGIVSAGSARVREMGLLVYAFGPPHEHYRRLNRLGTLLALARPTWDLLETPRTALRWAAIRGLRTVEETRMPESKGLRGLMELEDRQPDKNRPGCWRLVYKADVREESWDDTFRFWLAREENWLKARNGGGSRGRRRKPRSTDVQDV